MGKTGAGYTVVRADGQEKTYDGFVYEHRLVAERKIGRPLKPGEVVHHIDHVRSNNDPNNLIIFASDEDHRRYHSYGEYNEYAYIDDNGIAHCPSKMKSLNIPEEFKDYYKNNIKCIGFINDDNSISFRNPGSITASRSELKYLIRNFSFEEIGRRFNISGNAVKKKCKSYNLPYQKIIINSISDEDWKNL